MAIGDDARLRGILEKVELLTGERSDGSRRAVLISELQGLSQDLSDQYAAIKKSVRDLSVEFAQSSASFKEEILVRADEASALAEIVTTLKAKINDNEAQIQDTKRALATKTMAMAEHVSSLSAQVGDARANITNIQTVYASDKVSIAQDLTRIEATAGKQRTFRQTTAPANNTTNKLVIGDMWFDTDDNNKSYFWDGSAWVDTSATTIKIYRQTSAPTGSHKVGDLWYDTDDNNKVWYWDGSVWDDVSDGRAGKQRTFNQTTAPANDATNKLAIGDLWFDTDDKNRVYYWNGSSWIDISDGRFALLATTASVDEEKTSRVAADGALALALLASSVGSARVYWSVSPPPSSGRQTGDVWFDADDNYRVYSWQGSWVDNSAGTYKTGAFATIAQTVSAKLDPGGTLSTQWALVGSLGGAANDVVTLTGIRKSDGSTSPYKLKIDANVDIHGDVLIDGTITVNSDGTSPISQNAITQGNKGKGNGYASCQVVSKKAGDVFIVIGSYIGGSTSAGNGFGFGGGISGSMIFNVNGDNDFATVPIRGFAYNVTQQFIYGTDPVTVYYMTSPTTYCTSVIAAGAGLHTFSVSAPGLSEEVTIAVIRLST